MLFQTVCLLNVLVEKVLAPNIAIFPQRINNLHQITIMTFDMSNTSFCHGF